MVIVGVVLRTLVWWPSHNLFGVLEYDDGVYYTPPRLLLDGYLPYSDFTIVHPPGASLVLLPAAVFGHLFGRPDRNGRRPGRNAARRSGGTPITCCCGILHRRFRRRFM